MPKQPFVLGVHKSPKTAWQEKIHLAAIFNLILNLNIFKGAFIENHSKAPAEVGRGGGQGGLAGHHGALPRLQPHILLHTTYLDKGS